MSVKKLMPRIIEDIDPPFGPVAVMKYNNDGLYVPASDYDNLLARHNALREAVAWERECEQLDFWGVAYALCRRHPGNYIDTVRADFYAIRDSARAEVDRLIASEGAADCQGEG